MKKLSTCNRSATIIQMRWDIEYNPQKYLSNFPGGVQASASQPPDPHWKTFRVFFSRWGVVCLCIHCVVQNTKQHPFQIHAGSLNTFCVLFSCSFLSLVSRTVWLKVLPCRSAYCCRNNWGLKPFLLLPTSVTRDWNKASLFCWKICDQPASNLDLQGHCMSHNSTVVIAYAA
jgi:hypothetical protein